MFFFGEDTSLSTEYYVDRTRKYGPPYARGPVSEMSLKDAREAFVHFRMAYKLARREGAPEEITEALADGIIDTFRLIIAESHDIAKAIEEKRFQAVGRKLAVYKEIMQEVRHPSSADAG